MIRINKKFFIIFILALILSLIFGGIITYTILYVLIFAFIISWIFIITIKNNLYLKINYAKKYYEVGDLLEYTIQTNCDIGIYIPYIYITSEIIPNEMFLKEVFTITLSENKWIYREIILKKRGIYDLGKIKIEISDIFNIFNLVKDFDLNIKIKVYPKIYKVKSNYSIGKDIHIERIDKNSTSESQYMIKDLRKYRLGDSLKKVHWKLSAKYDELYVKNLETICGEESAVFIDMINSNYDIDNKLGEIEEKIIDISCSIVNILKQKDQFVEIFMNNNIINNWKVNNSNDFNQFLEYIVIMKSDGGVSISDFIVNNTSRINKMNKLMVITGNVTNDFINNTIFLTNKGFNISVVYCNVNLSNKNNSEQLIRYGVDCISSDQIIKKNLD